MIFATEVPPTTAVNAWRALNGLAAVSESQIDTSRINIMDARLSKAFKFAGRKAELLAQTFNLFKRENHSSSANTNNESPDTMDTYCRLPTR